VNVNGRAMTVLVADDDEDDRIFIRKAWAKERAPEDLRFVENGEELIDYLNHVGVYSDPALAPRPGMILLDLNMPRKDGREALKEIKADPELRQIPIVILTTSQADEDICGSYDLGATSFISKPLTLKALVNVIDILGKYWIDVVQFGPANISSIRCDPGQNVTAKTVLVVDDYDDLRSMISRVLTGLGYDVLEARSGNEAAVVYAEHQPDLVITDLIMPDGEGLELIKHLRGLYKHVEIIAMSGGGRESKTNYLSMARKLGADYTIEIPFSFEEFLSVVRLALETEPPPREIQTPKGGEPSPPQQRSSILAAKDCPGSQPP
jgi:two-component system, response regulator